MDTNVFVSRMKSDDIYNREAIQIEKSMISGDVSAETSVLTLVETASVASRLFDEAVKRKVVPGTKPEAEREEDKRSSIQQERQLFVIRTLQKLASLRLEFVNIPGESSSIVKGVPSSQPEIFNETILLSFFLPLRTFDLMHVAAAKYAKETNGELSAFVTGDNAFLGENNKTRVSEILGMPVLSPKEFAKLLPPGRTPRERRAE